MRYITSTLALVALSACNKPMPDVSTTTAKKNDAAQVAATTITEKAKPDDINSVHGPQEIKALVSTVEGDPPSPVYLVPVGDAAQHAQMADLQRQSGVACGSVSAAYQLKQEDGQMLQVFRIDCDTGEFQATILNGQTYIKPWTGRLLGN